MSDTSTKANLIAKTLFIAGGIILFIVLAIFILRMIPVALSNITNIGSSITSGLKKSISGEKIVLATDSDTAEAQVPITVSFEYTPGEQLGQYFVSYDCVENLFFDIESKDGPKRIICDTPLKLGSNLNAISLIPLFSEQEDFADTKITILYKDENGNTLATGSKTLTVTDKTLQTADVVDNPFDANGTLSGSTVSTKPITQSKPVVQNSPSPTNYTNLTQDLALTYVGSVDSNSTFLIHVYNYGNTNSGPWEFSYTDTENPSSTKLSPLQASLAPGQGLAVTVRFDGQKNKKQSISVTIDPSNKLKETNESNNTGSVEITGNSSGSNTSDSYNSKDDADLLITSMDVGRISGSRFIEDDEIDENDTAAVRFVVKNQGGESTGSWKFKIDNLPYNNDDTYTSKSYASLRPGQSIEIIADFDQIDEGRYSIKIEVDSQDNVDEEKENNNTESETLEVNN